VVDVVDVADVDCVVVVAVVVLVCFEAPQPVTAPQSAMRMSARLLMSLQFGRVG
jgi:hypothetical protein